MSIRARFGMQLGCGAFGRAMVRNMRHVAVLKVHRTINRGELWAFTMAWSCVIGPATIHVDMDIIDGMWRRQDGYTGPQQKRDRLVDQDLGIARRMCGTNMETWLWRTSKRIAHKQEKKATTVEQEVVLKENATRQTSQPFTSCERKCTRRLNS